MSEQIKSTVFRFATLRAPELITETQKNYFHIHHPNPTTTGFFADELADPAATQTLQRAALQFKANSFTPFKTTADIIAAVTAGFLDYAVWVARNKTEIYLKEAVGMPEEPDALLPTNLLLIWDNLFYQLITGENPQVRQQCIEVLVANGFILAGAELYRRELAAARVIIPKAFYGTNITAGMRVAEDDEEPTTPSISTSGLNVSTAAFAAQKRIEGYQQLLQELGVAEKKYVKANQAAYDTAYATYKASLKDAISSFYTENTVTDADRQDQKPDMGFGAIELAFSPLPEMALDFLENHLSAAALMLAQKLDFPGEVSFAEAIQTLKELIQQEAQIVASNDAGNHQSLIVNNVAFPVSRSPLSTSELYSFSMVSFSRDDIHFSIFCTINVGDQVIRTTACNYQADLPSGEIDREHFVETVSTNTITLEFFSDDELLLEDAENGFHFLGTIHTNGGFDLKFNLTFSPENGASGIMTVEKQEGGAGGGDEPTGPLGYGIRRLGLADYRKVEQTVCCYLPGEVSHIENIMAREYKERSSRRLTRSEDTTTLETSMEKETQKDSSSTERYELQKEIDSVISKDTSVEANASVHTKIFNANFDSGASFASNTSREDSNRTAVNYSKEVTEKALERVVQKIREERVIKIIEEFEEQNRHGFDNRQGDKHVSGVYRWVDKVYKNQVHNYGKRLMYEFMVPEPAVFHHEAIKVLAAGPQATVIEKPRDPRTDASFFQMADSTKVNDVTFPYWAGKYKADVKATPDFAITIAQSFDLGAKETSGPNYYVGSKSFKMEIPEGYEAISAVLGWSYVNEGGNTTRLAVVRVGSSKSYYMGGPSGDGDEALNFSTHPIRKDLAVSVEGRNLGGIIVNVTATLRRTTEAYANWQLETFNAIIEAYEEQLDIYNKQMEALVRPTASVTETNPNFYRQIENTVLRKNCISYLVTDAQMGKKFYQGNVATNIRPMVTAQMDRYASMVKFIEQAFEWELMSYKFYPFYWGQRAKWQQYYQQDVADALFRSFLQSGMARVIVSIRPGFEEAVMYFMATGEIWNGGQVPAIGDDLYLSIVEELKKPVYTINETWETRVPTTLTVLQAGNIGLVVEDGLPCDCGDENDIEQNTDKLGVVLPE